MKNFDEFIERGIVKIRKKNVERVKSLIEEASKRLNFYNSIPISEKSANYVIENMYDVVRELIEARMLLEGYKSYSHEASIAYLYNDKDFTPSLLEELDRLRRKRHGIHYYGKRVSAEDAQDARKLAQVLVPKMKAKIGLL